jgi:hypothetical protein
LEKIEKIKYLIAINRHYSTENDIVVIHYVQFFQNCDATTEVSPVVSYIVVFISTMRNYLAQMGAGTELQFQKIESLK